MLVAALLGAACTDTVTPPAPAPTAAVTAASTTAASTINLWGFNGTLPPQSGTTLGKEFNPENPPLGSTVVATFVWVGSTNVIDSVADFLWTGRRVGNTYRLVEYVTSGGISMATYVATSVQNYPVPKNVEGEELVVNAYLRTAVSAGGALVSAYTGVNPGFTQAVGAHRSAAGSGSSTPTTAHPGTIAVGAGALVYAVSMASDGLVGHTAPSGFTLMTGLATESPSMQFDVEYRSYAAADSVDPRWGWSFQSANTWLASAIALNPDGVVSNQPPVAQFTSSCSGLSCSFTNSSSDADGTITQASWDFGDGATSGAQNPSHSYTAGGQHTVTLTVTDDQGATNATSHTVTVTSPTQPPVASFTFSCPSGGPTCTFTSTSSDPDGTIASYSWAFGDGGTATTQSPSHTYAAAGTYTVTLTVTDDRGGTGAASNPVTVTARFAATHLAFTVQPSNITAGGLISPAVRVAAQDDAGNTDASFSGAITVALGANPGGGTLAGTRTDTAMNGVATFSTLSIDRAGSGYTLQATAAGLSGATSVPFTVTAPSGTGIALDREIGNLEVFPNGSTQIIKGFNPINPRLGDAIVATFYWVGSTNIIASVTDHLTDPNFTPVGNTYHLVDYRTAGGISMATYVATNVQGFPPANQEQSNVLAVRANFTQSITYGGIQLSSYSGVDPTWPRALVAAQSAAGSGTDITAADPGALTVPPGALVYAVTMSNGVFGSEQPGAPFTNLAGMANVAMVTNAVYGVLPGGGSTHPRWIYHYDGGQYTWLAAILALNPAP